MENYQFIQNKYTKWYYSIIYRAKSRVVDQEKYYEKHHIIPKSLGGSNLKDNLVKLFPREHFICHLLLIKMTTGLHKNKMSFALHIMSRKTKKHQRDYKISSKIYEFIKKNHIRALSERPHCHKGKSYEEIYGKKRADEIKNKLKNITRTQESNDKRSAKLKGKKLPPRSANHCAKLSFIRSEENKSKLSEKRKGVSWGNHSDEHRLNMSERQKGIPQPTTTCVHCNKEISKMAHGKYHGDKCKMKIDN